MKKFELVLFALFLIGFAFKIFHLPGHGILLNLSLLLISQLYFFFGLFLFNNIRFREIFKSKWYKDLDVWNAILAPAAGISFSTLLLGILFKIQMYPGAGVMMVIGISSSILVLITAVISALAAHSMFFKRNIIRIVLITGTGLFLYLLPYDTYIDFMYRQKPEYAELLKLRQQYPHDPEINRQIQEYRMQEIKNKVDN